MSVGDETKLDEATNLASLLSRRSLLIRWYRKALRGVVLKRGVSEHTESVERTVGAPAAAARSTLVSPGCTLPIAPRNRVAADRSIRKQRRDRLAAAVAAVAVGELVDDAAVDAAGGNAQRAGRTARILPERSDRLLEEELRPQRQRSQTGGRKGTHEHRCIAACSPRSYGRTSTWLW